jgi:hypothetical protein
MFVTPDGMFFQAINEIFLLSHDTFTVIPAKSRFGRAQQANGRIYVGTPEDGLNILEGTTLKPLPGTARIGGEAFPVVLPYDDHRLLVGTRRDGIFLYDGAALTPFATDVDPVFKTTQIYRGLVLPGPSIAIETTSAGLIILTLPAPPHEGGPVERAAFRHGLLRDA